MSCRNFDKTGNCPEDCKSLAETLQWYISVALSEICISVPLRS